MAGHSKWANIRHRKERVDAKKGKIFARLIREITVAARTGGDPSSNPRLRVAIAKSNGFNIAKDSIERAIKRGSGQMEGETYEEIQYEGYSAGGAAILVECLTDNKNRTLSEVRSVFTKNGGNLGTEGSVRYLFEHIGLFLFDNVSEHQANRLTDIAIEGDASDINHDGDSFEIVCAPTHFAKIYDAIDADGIDANFAEIIMRPQVEVTLSGTQEASTQKLINALEDLDDTQHIYTTLSG